MALREEGPAGLAAEKLARRLGVSRGSFYWHFEGADAFESAVLGAWEDRWTEAFIRQVEGAGGDGRQQLALLVMATSRADASLYSAAKRMARERSELQELLTRIDQRRLEFLRRILVAGGVDSEAAGLRAQIVYAWAMGQMLISGNADPVPSGVANAIIDFAFEGPRAKRGASRSKLHAG